MERISFVDCHSHVVPSGDDGAPTIDEGVALCEAAARGGTAILFATPHVWPHLPLTDGRERLIRGAYGQMRERVPLELRLGFELTPSEALLREDPARYELPGTRLVLVEMPFRGPAALLLAVAEHIERAGLRPVVAHPERTEAVLSDPGLAGELAARGWLLQVNATSLTGWDGPEIEELAWGLVEDGGAVVVASDGHRRSRPARLDAAFAAVYERVGEAAWPLFDGSSLIRESFPAASPAV